MSTPVKRRKFSLDFKKSVIDAAEKNNNQSDLARQFSIPRPSLRRILEEKDAILKAVADGAEAKRARMTSGRFEKLEEALVTWFKQMRSENVPVSGDLFKVRFYLLFCSAFLC